MDFKDVVRARRAGGSMVLADWGQSPATRSMSGLLLSAFLERERDIAMRRAGEVMSRKLVNVSPGATAFEARHACRSEQTTHVLVMESKDLLGALCSCDIRGARPNDRVSWLMSSHVITIDPDVTVEASAKLMRHTGVGFLPVAERGRVVGVVTRGDLKRIGVPLEITGPICTTCGSHHHVRPSIGLYEARLCCECAERSHPPTVIDKLFVDLGVGD
jgi:CBS domain-containing protein